MLHCGGASIIRNYTFLDTKYDALHRKGTGPIAAGETIVDEFLARVGPPDQRLRHINPPEVIRQRMKSSKITVDLPSPVIISYSCMFLTEAYVYFFEAVVCLVLPSAPNQVEFHFLIYQGHYHQLDWFVFYGDSIDACCCIVAGSWEVGCPHLVLLDHPRCHLRRPCLPDGAAFATVGSFCGG